MRTRITLLTLALVLPQTGCRKNPRSSESSDGPTKPAGLGLAIAQQGGQQESREPKEFREFSPPGGDYTVLMPGPVGPPARAPQRYKITGYGAERAPGEGYAVVAGDIPPGFTLDGFVSELGGGYDGANTWNTFGQERPDELWVEFQISNTKNPWRGFTPAAGWSWEMHLRGLRGRT